MKPVNWMSMLISFHVTKDEYDALMRGDKDTLKVTPMQIVEEGMGEVCHTKALASYLKKELGDNFTIFANQELLGRTLPLCKYATSRPDLAFYHNKKYVYEGNLGCSGLVTKSQRITKLTRRKLTRSKLTRSKLTRSKPLLP